jgi:deoxycytidylate deaminase
MKKCLKQVVTATIYDKDGKVVVVGRNDIENEEVTECPRAGMPTGVGYHLCQEVCRQKGHAEVQAIDKAVEMGVDLTTCSLVLEGHTYICQDCVDYMTRHGLMKWTVNAERHRQLEKIFGRAEWREDEDGRSMLYFGYFVSRGHFRILTAISEKDLEPADEVGRKRMLDAIESDTFRKLLMMPEMN